MINSNVSLNELMRMVNSSLHDVERGEEFKVQDLFRGFEWKRIPRAMRTKLGSMVLILAKSGSLSSKIEPTRKTSLQQQMYIKK